ncbi:MAG: hypothetical protein LIO96_11785 [Lachnospiraceae bacterium]|nr:hypothetical protein [Lachnospiraceae bacterium]
MTMKDFYTKYNINTFEFAGVIGVGQRSLKKYENGEPLRESTKTRIEKAVKIIINNDLHLPKAPIG